MEKLNEGIDIKRGYGSRPTYISYNPNHEELLVTGSLNDKIPIKPIYSTWKNRIGKRFKHISLFKRKRDKNDFFNDDANPIIYALKKEKNCHFRSTKDFNDLFRCFLRIINELHESYDTICIVPSSSSLNKLAMKFIAKHVNHKYEVTDYMFKRSAKEVWDDFIDWNAMEENEYDFDTMIRNFKSYFKKMPNKQFRYHDIPVHYRDYIINCFYIPDNLKETNEPYFNGKKVLIIDDTIATGKTLSDTTITIANTFDCKSITILTLFSKL